LLQEHPDVDVDEYKDEDGERALYSACCDGHTECARLLIDHNADVNAKDDSGWSALYGAAVYGSLSCVELLVQNGADVNSQTDDGVTPLMNSVQRNLIVAQYLLDHKADIHYRVSEDKVHKNEDTLCSAMTKYATDRTPGAAFAVLSCNTDAKNVKIDRYSTTAKRDAHVEEYKHVLAYIDESHRLLNLVLSEDVPVDPRFMVGIYQEPLERVLEYLGLSMSKDQVVNTSIDGEGVKRALIPGHLLNANHWFNKYKSR